MWEDLFHHPYDPSKSCEQLQTLTFEKKGKKVRAGGELKNSSHRVHSPYVLPMSQADLPHVRGSRSQVGVAWVPKLAHNQGKCSPGQRQVERGRVVDGTLSRVQPPPRGSECLGMNVARTSKASWKPGDSPASVGDLAEVLGFLINKLTSIQRKPQPPSLSWKICVPIHKGHF